MDRASGNTLTDFNLEDRGRGPKPSPDCIDACNRGNLGRLRSLLHDQEVPAISLVYLLDEAVKTSHLDIINFLFETFPELKPDTATAHYAAWSGLDAYRLIHARLPEIIDVNFGYFGDALQVAVRRSDVPLLQYLLDSGADPGKTPNKNTPRCLYMFLPIENSALSTTSPVVSRILVEHGATLEHTTALDIASGLGRIEVVKFLLEAGADISYVYCGDPMFEPNHGHGAPLHSAVRSRHFEVVEYLIERGAKVDVLNSVGQTPLAIAMSQNDTEMLHMLNGPV